MINFCLLLCLILHIIFLLTKPIRAMSATTLATVPPQYVIAFCKNKILTLHIVVKTCLHSIVFGKGFAL
jgi:hypothetical protein